MAKAVIIRNAESDLVVESTSSRVFLEVYEHRASQIWYMIHIGDGSFQFQNKLSE